jgi:hypothetical protein
MIGVLAFSIRTTQLFSQCTRGGIDGMDGMDRIERMDGVEKMDPAALLRHRAAEPQPRGFLTQRRVGAKKAKETVAGGDDVGRARAYIRARA